MVFSAPFNVQLTSQVQHAFLYFTVRSKEGKPFPVFEVIKKI